MSEEVRPETPIGEDKPGFRFPTAYTVLFVLLILVVIATWIIPAGMTSTVMVVSIRWPPSSLPGESRYLMSI